MPKLIVNNLSKNFGNKNILFDINLELHTGVYGLVGPNGSGKTTLFRCICSLYDAQYESVFLDDISIKTKGYTNNIGYLPQSFQSFREMSVEDMLRFFCHMKKIDWKSIDGEIKTALIKTHLVEQRNKKIGAISGGMLRRLGIAQSILGCPKLVLLDEPTVGLDPEEQLRFWDIVKEQGRHSIIVLSTHIIEDVLNVCENVIVINEGRICTVENVIKAHDASKKDSEIEDNYLWYSSQLKKN